MGSKTYQCAPNKIPHKVDFILGCCGRHVGLLQVGRHSGMVREFVEESSQFFHERGPFGGREGGKLGSDETRGEFFARGGVGVHGGFGV